MEPYVGTLDRWLRAQIGYVGHQDFDRGLATAIAIAVRRTAAELRPDSNKQAAEMEAAIVQALREPASTGQVIASSPPLKSLVDLLAGQLNSLNDLASVGVIRSLAGSSGIVHDDIAQRQASRVSVRSRCARYAW